MPSLHGRQLLYIATALFYYVPLSQSIHSLFIHKYVDLLQQNFNRISSN